MPYKAYPAFSQALQRTLSRFPNPGVIESAPKPRAMAVAAYSVAAPNAGSSAGPELGIQQVLCVICAGRDPPIGSADVTQTQTDP